MQNYASRDGEVHPKDCFQTPPEAVAILEPYIRRLRIDVVWEPAAGEGYLARWLRAIGMTVIEGDLDRGQDYLTSAVPAGVDAHITNPPYSRKAAWLERACEQGIPFALLIPSEAIFAGRDFAPLIERYDLRLISPLQRIRFKTPQRGWKDSSPQFPTGWLTYQMGVPHQITYVKVPSRADVLARWGVALEEGEHVQAVF